MTKQTGLDQLDFGIFGPFYIRFFGPIDLWIFGPLLLYTFGLFNLWTFVYVWIELGSLGAGPDPWELELILGS